MNLRETKVKELGVDFDYIYRVFGGNENLYLSLCNKFIQDPSYNKFQKSLMHQDYKDANLHLHTLKGVAANLGFCKLAEISNLLMTDIRCVNGNLNSIHYQELQYEYNRIISIIKST